MAPVDDLFLDASVLIAAAASSSGGSALVIELCMKGKATALVSRTVLLEAERNIRIKLGEAVLIRYYNLIAQIDPKVIPTPNQSMIDAAAEVIQDKDAHVLAAARDGNASHIITLDRRHFLSEDLRQAILPIHACTPGEYLQTWIASQKT